MNIHEYQAKTLFETYGIPVSNGTVVSSYEEARTLADSLGVGAYLVKAQVHSGGRGKAGGVKITASKNEIADIAKQMIGMTLVTKQTGAQGKKVRKVLVCECEKIVKEYYLSFAIDGAHAQIVMIASKEGGMEIEQLAHSAPEKIITVAVDPAIGLMTFQSRAVAVALGLDPLQTKQFISIAASLYQLFTQKDCSLIEINPLASVESGNLVALDAKINFDDNALFRHPDIAALRDIDEEDTKEVEASKYDLNYVQLDGNIGCMVNGAGLAMATMDIIKAYGGVPANFLDVGGGATAEKIAGAFRILLSDKNVKGIFINIFGGIMKCDIIAQGVVAAAREQAVTVVLVVRLEGTNAEEGKRILAESGLNIVSADDMAQGARLICEFAGKEAAGV